ncbi:MAG: hypothetical protein Tsb0013_15210 [Phycisphaerales bacterium]
MTAPSSSNTKWGLPRALVEPTFPTPGMHIGGYTLLDRAHNHPFAERWIARPEHPGDTDHPHRRVLLYRVTAPITRDAQPAALDHPHILRADETTIRTGAGRWLVAAYPGRWGQVFTLDHVVRSRETGGFGPNEAALLAQHLLAAAAHAHDAGVCHGPIDPSEIVLSPAGQAKIELYALKRRLRAERDFDDQSASQEVASIASLARALAPVERHARRARPLHRWAQSVTDRAPDDGIDARAALDELVAAMRLPA